MSNISRRGVVYNFDISPYKLIVDYQDEELEFVFSSQLYKDKFYEKYLDNRDVINSSLSKRFKLNIEVNKLADLQLYRNTEKRGFLIRGKEEYRCLNNLKLDGVNLTTRK